MGPRKRNPRKLPELEEVGREKLIERYVRKRFIRARAYGKVAKEKICFECSAPCCSKKSINAALEPIEMPRVRAGDLLVSYSGSVRPWSKENHRGRPIKGAVEGLVKTGYEGPASMVEGIVGWGYRRVRGKPLIKKSPWGACIYFNSNTNTCSIYNRRPLSCRAWFCGRGTDRDGAWRNLNGKAGGFAELQRLCNHVVEEDHGGGHRDDADGELDRVSESVLQKMRDAPQRLRLRKRG
jgi:Fe-S-cluster containining protein